MKTYFVYILLCADNSFYVGVTNDLNKRISSHSLKIYKKSYTASRLPVKLVWHCMFNDIKLALAFEKQIKKWSRAKKEALIKNDWDKIKQLAKGKRDGLKH